MVKKALVNFYAKLLQRGVKTEEEIPKDILDQVKEKMKQLSELTVDPETQTPADDQEVNEDE